MLRRCLLLASQAPQCFFHDVPPREGAFAVTRAANLVAECAQKDVSKTIHHIRGPPGGGKTTLARLALAETELFGQPTSYFDSVPKAFSQFEAQPQWFHTHTAIIDDCQMLLRSEYLPLLQLFKNDRVHVILCGTMATPAATPLPPAKVQHYFLNGVFGDAKETQAWFCERLEKCRLQWQRHDIEQFASLAVATTAAHVGLLQAAGSGVELDRRDRPFCSEAEAVKFIIDKMCAHRLLKPNGKNDLVSELPHSVRRETVAEVLVCGSSRALFTTDDSPTDCERHVASDNRRAVDGGLFFPSGASSREFEAQAGLVVPDEVDTRVNGVPVCLAHPTQWEFSEKHLQALATVDVQRMATTDAPSSVVDVLLAAVPCIKWQRFVAAQFTREGGLDSKNSYDGGAGSLKELKFREVFNLTAEGVFGKAVRIEHEVQTKARARLDAVYKFGDVSVGIEFLNCHRGFDEPFPLWKKTGTMTFAQDFATHHKRWCDKYSSLIPSLTDYGTVGIVGPSATVSAANIAAIHRECEALNCGDHPWAIVCISGHSRATVFHGHTTASMLTPHHVDVVRNGVPQKLDPRDPSKAVTARRLLGDPVFSCSLSRWVVQPYDLSGASFPVKTELPDVMHLKKAIKLEKSNDLKDIDADRLVIRKAGGDGVPLAATAKLEVSVQYTFEAPAQPVTAPAAPQPQQLNEWIVYAHGVDAGSAFAVEPKKPTVMHLKKAIKLEKSPRLDHIAADELVIRKAGDGDDAPTPPLDAEAALLPGLKYTYEAPAQK